MNGEAPGRRVREGIIELLRALEANAASAHPEPFQPPKDLVTETVLTLHLACLEHLRSIRTLLEIDCTHAGRSLARGLVFDAMCLCFWAHLADGGRDWRLLALGYVHDGVLREAELNKKALRHGLPGARQRVEQTEARLAEFEKLCRERHGLRGPPRRWRIDARLDDILRELGRENTAWVIAYFAGAVHTDRLHLAVHRRKIRRRPVDMFAPDDVEGIYATGSAAAHYFSLAHRSAVRLLEWNTRPLIESFGEVVDQRLVEYAKMLGLEAVYAAAIDADESR